MNRAQLLYVSALLGILGAASIFAIHAARPDGYEHCILTHMGQAHTREAVMLVAASCQRQAQRALKP